MQRAATRGLEHDRWTTNVDFFVDPSCPWAWMTSRWLVQVAPQRDLNIRWRSFSIAHRDGDVDVAPWLPYKEVARARRAMSTRILRLFEAVRGDCGEGAVGDLYTQIGRQYFQPGRTPEAPAADLLVTVLAAAGLDRRLEANADDPQWDPVVVSSTEEALAIVGRGIETPAIVLDGDVRRGMSGPIVSPPPQGDDGLRLWDAFRTLLEAPGVFEVRRARTFPPQLPAVS